MNRVSTTRLGFYVLLQLGAAKSIVLSNTAFCFVYVGFLLSMPWRQAGLVFWLILGFVLGLVMDVFYDTLGMHAFACVLLVYARSFLVRRMLSMGSYEAGTRPTLSSLGWKRFSLFALGLLLLHHGALFGLDVWRHALWHVGLRKALSSTLLSYAAIVVVQAVGQAVAPSSAPLRHKRRTLR